MGKIVDMFGKRFDAEQALLNISYLECRDSLAEFIRQAWHVIEPGSDYTHNWHIDFIAEHLQAITDGVELDDGSPYNRLMVAVPPGCMKSLLMNVFWPAWEVGPMKMTHMRYICVSHSQDLAIRDGLKMRRLVESEWYQQRFPWVKIAKDQNQKQKFEFEGGGFRQCCAANSITGARADRIIVDDMMSVADAASVQIKQATNQQFFEAIPTRLVNPKKSSIVIIQQRLADDDIIGSVLERKLPYDFICLPMRYDPSRSEPTLLGLEDPRSEEGELLFPDRFPEEVVERDEEIMGKWAAAAQFQQMPIPRGGGVIQADWWQRSWESPTYPQFDYIVAAVDGAFTTKSENDPSAMTVWGVWAGGDQTAIPTRTITSEGVIEWDKKRLYNMGKNSVMLIYAWAERLEFYELVERISETMSDYRVDRLIIENKANGPNIAQEMQRLYSHEDWGVQLIDPKGVDKLSRLYAVQHIFTDGIVYAPNTSWADMVINEVAVFPKGRHDDLTDTVSMALTYLRKAGLLTRQIEHVSQIERDMEHSGAPPEPLYPV